MMTKLSIFILFGCCINQVAMAACQRADVDHYLSKGFTPEQITLLCTSQQTDVPDKITQTASKPKREPDKVKQAPSPAVVAHSRVSLDDPATYLLSAVNAEDVVINNDQLRYTVQPCINHGPQSALGRRNEACPLIAFKISLMDLKIIKRSKRVGIFGENQIIVQGNIERSFVNFNELSRSEQIVVTRTYKGKPNTAIPIRNSANVDKAVTALRHLSL